MKLKKFKCGRCNLNFYVETFDGKQDPDIIYCPCCDFDLMMELDIVSFDDKSNLDKEKIAEFGSLLNEDYEQLKLRLTDLNKIHTEACQCMSSAYIAVDDQSAVSNSIDKLKKLDEINKNLGKMNYCIKKLYICLDNLDKNIHLVEGL